MNALYVVSCRLRLITLLGAAAVIFTLTGCGGGTSVSSSHAAQSPAAQTTGQALQQSPQQSVADPASTASTQQGLAPEESVQQESATDEPDQNPPQNDQVAERESVTIGNTAPPQATAAPNNPTPANITDLILVTGQSNALGADTRFDPNLDGPDQRVFAYTHNGWQVASLTQIWDLGWFPRGNPGSDPSNNLSLHFGKQVTAADPGRVVGFVLVTGPGQPISYWQPYGDFFNTIRNRVSNAINELPSKSRIDGILWHQGESDGQDDPAYGRALYALIEAFRSESWFGANRPFICGETAALPVNNQLNRLNRDGNPDTACVAAEGLETRGDDAHFSAGALRTLGRRYADQYLRMTR